MSTTPCECDKNYVGETSRSLSGKKRHGTHGKRVILLNGTRQTFWKRDLTL